jgi:hypothetical protein
MIHGVSGCDSNVCLAPKAKIAAALIPVATYLIDYLVDDVHTDPSPEKNQ